MDQQGRIRIPQSLIEYAEIKKDVVMVGVLERAEIWAKENWNKYYKKADSQFIGDKDSFEKLQF
jgi:MraZ protein